jgi:thiol-disulfide isomerase/thioredoxin
MAETLTKTSFVSSWHGNRNQQHQRVSMVPKTCSFNTGLKSFPSLKMKSQFLRSSSFSSDFHGKKPLFRVNRSIPRRVNSQFSVSAAPKMTLRIGKVQKWWEKGHQPNMREVTSAQDLVDSLLKAGDKLVIVDFFSPGCGGCKALHPKICQFAEMNPDVEFLQVNYEEHKSMCYSLNVHVLPFFRFYRGAHGKLCSFSCTNATIKKFRDALAKHTPDRCSLEPTKGLEEKELIALSENRDLDFTYTPKPSQPVLTPANEELATEAAPSLPSKPKERTLITAWR